MGLKIEYKGWTIRGFRFADGSRSWASKEGVPGALMYYSSKDSPETLVRYMKQYIDTL